MKKYLFIVGLFLIGMAVNAQSYTVIVNKSNSVSSLSKKDASALFLKKSKKWDNGQKVVVIDQKGNSEVRKTFSTEVHKKSVNAIKSYWQQAVFSGRGTPPVEKSSDVEVIAFVKSNPGAIGYVTSSANVSEVKALTIN